MKIDISGFNDLGKFSYGTGILMDGGVFDTEKYCIYVWTGESLSDCEEQKIESAADLCRYLWSNPGVATGTKNGMNGAWFCKEPKTWWHSRFDESIVRDDKEHARIQKKIDREQNPKKLSNLQAKLKWTDTASLKEMVASYDSRMAEIIAAIVERNSVGNAQ